METVASKFNEYQRYLSQIGYPDEIQPEADEHQSNNEGEAKLKSDFLLHNSKNQKLLFL